MGLSIPEAEEFAAVPGHGVKVTHEGKEIVIANRTLMKQTGVDLGDKKEIVSMLEEKGNTVMIITAEGQLKGFIAVADTPKENAAEVIKVCCGEFCPAER